MKCANCNAEYSDVAPVVSALCKVCRPLQIIEVYFQASHWIPECKLFMLPTPVGELV